MRGKGRRASGLERVARSEERGEGCELSDYVEYAGGSEDRRRNYGIAIAHKPKL